MKKTLFALAIAACGHAMAAGPYDGIYVNTSNQSEYVSVHTNGNQMVVTTYEILPASNIFFTSNIGTVAPRQVNVWQLLQGTINGNVVGLAGQAVFNQCNIRVTATFGGSDITAVVTSSSSSGAGFSSSINCGALVGGTPTRFSKIF
ncbi:MAG: hypothetical protein QE290_10485 [Acidovorax sp.]|uniref:hypothetical protein n=1 Tax=Acidovorax sp. TaxID=1872122 RepID=UPI00262A66A9|nr:hypothetical protein [Acidovorax sp.]MDH4464449.1 hypothetical protein [Acidovorax sp.]